MNCPKCEVEMHIVKKIEWVSSRVIKYGKTEDECPKCGLRVERVKK